MQYDHNDIGPFQGKLVRLGGLPAYGVRRTHGGYSWYSDFEEAYQEMVEENKWNMRGYKRKCPGRDHARKLALLIAANPCETLQG